MWDHLSAATLPGIALYPLLFRSIFHYSQQFFKSCQNNCSLIISTRSIYALIHKLIEAIGEASLSWSVIAWTVLLRATKQSEHCMWLAQEWNHVTGNKNKIKPVRDYKQEAVHIFPRSIQLLDCLRIFKNFIL